MKLKVRISLFDFGIDDFQLICGNDLDQYSASVNAFFKEVDHKFDGHKQWYQ